MIKKLLQKHRVANLHNLFHNNLLCNISIYTSLEVFCKSFAQGKCTCISIEKVYQRNYLLSTINKISK